MINNKIKILIALIIITIASFFWKNKIIAVETLANQLSGKFLLQTEGHGEVWYIYPRDHKKYLLGKANDMFAVAKEFGKNINDTDLAKIPLADINLNNGIDSDFDGLSDDIENSLGINPQNADSDNDGYKDKDEILNNYNPSGKGKIIYDNKIAKENAGYILINDQSRNGAWYINPNNLKKYYFSSSIDIFNIIKKISLGITNSNLYKIEQSSIDPSYTSENIKNKYTVVTQNNTRKFIATDKNYSFEYPDNWRIRQFADSPDQVQITDASYDFIEENKAVISIYYLTAGNNYSISSFRDIKKDGVQIITDKETNINNFNGYENSYQYLTAYEKTTTIEINPGYFLRVSLVSTKDDDNYKTIYDNLLKSLALNK